MNWDDLDLRQQARMILECIPLTAEQYREVMHEWAQNTYPDTFAGQQRALSELQELAKWKSLSPASQQGELDRRAKEKEQWLSR